MSDEEEIIRLMRRTPFQEMLNSYIANAFQGSEHFFKWFEENGWTATEFDTHYNEYHKSLR